MKNAIGLVRNLAKQDSGQDLLEYAFILALMGLGAVVSMKGLVNSIGTTFNNAGNLMTSSN